MTAPTTAPTSAGTGGINAGINIIRGYLILGVILEHLWSDVRYTSDTNHDMYVRFVQRAFDGEWSRLPTSLVDVLFSGGYLIPSFMMLSGASLYLASARHGGIRGADLVWWLRRRFRILLVPYYFGIGLVAVTIVAIAVVQMALHGESFVYQLQHVTQSKYDYALQGRWAMLASLTIVPRLLNDEWLMVPPGILWFVVLLSQYYFAFPVLFRLMHRIGPARFVAVALVATMAAKLILFAVAGGLDSATAYHLNHAFIPFRWYEFSLGMVVGYVLTNRRELLRERFAPQVVGPLVAGGLSMEITGMLMDNRGSPLAVVAAPLVITGMAAVYLPILVKLPGRLEATWPALVFAMCGPLSYPVLLASEPLRLVGSLLMVEEVPGFAWWSFLLLYVPLSILLARPIARVLGIGPQRLPSQPRVPAPALESQPASAAGGGT